MSREPCWPAGYPPLLDAAGSAAVGGTSVFLCSVALLRLGPDNAAFTLVRRLGDVACALGILIASSRGGGAGGGGGLGGLRALFRAEHWGTAPLLAAAIALVSGACNTGGSLLTQRAQLRGVDPGTAISMAALYPALVTVMSVATGFERMSLLKFAGTILAVLSGVCFAKAK